MTGHNGSNINAKTMNGGEAIERTVPRYCSRINVLDHTLLSLPHGPLSPTGSGDGPSSKASLTAKLGEGQGHAQIYHRVASTADATRMTFLSEDEARQ